jgi:hypothetical protein
MGMSERSERIHGSARGGDTSAYPEPSFDHLLRLSDEVGLLEHAHGADPRHSYGYCLDDVARGLVVIFREPDPTADLLRLAERYLAFVSQAQTPWGDFHNRLGYDRRWHDAPDTGDWWGRALWALGTVVARSSVGWLRDEAGARFDLGLRCRSRLPRAMAFAALGAAEVLAVQPGHTRARRLLADTATAIGPAGVDARWLWPEPRLGYANAVLAEALIVAGRHLGRGAATAKGLRLLAWLLEQETAQGHLSVTPVGGWGPGEPRPGFDQQPIEAASLADACATAFALTGDPRWADGVHLAVRWFLGDNDAATEMRDPNTGGGYDRLTSTGRNATQGAESTLALLSTLQHGRRLATPRRSVGPSGQSIRRLPAAAAPAPAPVSGGSIEERSPVALPRRPTTRGSTTARGGGNGAVAPDSGDTSPTL